MLRYEIKKLKYLELTPAYCEFLMSDYLESVNYYIGNFLADPLKMFMDS